MYGHAKVQTSTIQRWIKQHDFDEAMEVVALIRAQIHAIKRTVEAEGLDCEFELRRSFDVYLDAEQAEQARAEFSNSVKTKQWWTEDSDCAAPAFAEQVSLVLKASSHCSSLIVALHQVSSIKGAKAAMSVPVCSLWPYKFVSQLLDRLVERKAVNLQTNTPVRRISKDGEGVNILHTDRGRLRAKKLVFATNGYTGGISPKYVDSIIPIRGTATHITPRKPVSPHPSNTYNINYRPGRTDYLNPRPDGGIVVGGGQWTYSEDRSKWYNDWDDSKQLLEAKPHFQGLIQRHFKGWDDSGAEVESIWTGIMGRTADEMPHIGEVPGSNGTQYIIAGFNGGGMGTIYTSAVGLAKMVGNGTSFEDTGLPRLFKSTKERLDSPQNARSHRSIIRK